MCVHPLGKRSLFCSPSGLSPRRGDSLLQTERFLRRGWVPFELGFALEFQLLSRQTSQKSTAEVRQRVPK
jgi:hypothetical protein